MTDSAQPLTQTVTPDRWAGLSMNFIDAGYIGLLVKNGQLVRKLEPGRHFSFALPYLENSQIILVDGKIRNLEVISEGDFVSRDQYLVNISLSVMYQVVDPKRIALELSDPLAALTSAIKDNLAVVVNLMKLEQLNQIGRVQIRDYLLSHLDSFYTLGFNLDDVRVSDISFPQGTGVIRQLEGLTAKQEADHEAQRQAIASAERTVYLNPPAQPNPFEAPPTPLIQPVSRKPLPPTTLATDAPTAQIVNSESGEMIKISVNPFTIGRETHNSLVLTDDLCSRNHARIDRVNEAQGGYYQITDTGSSNGTLLNGQRLVPQQPVKLETGAQIKIGTTEWIFEA
jgi:hypothetical protein